MKLQRLYSLVRQAVDDYHMIEHGDVIAVGLSGGKDSLTLLYALCGLRRFYPASYRLQAIMIDLGYDGFLTGIQPIQALCDRLEVPLIIVPTKIRQIVFEERQEAHPCALCAKLRRGALNNAALASGCNKVAYGHHKDDIIETMMMSLLYEGQFYAFPPVTHLDKTNLDVIRPLMYVGESDVLGFSHRYDLPVYQNPCPADGATRRAYVKELLAEINRQNHGVKERLFHAIIHGHISDWPERN